MQRVLVTGGAGFLGSHLCDRIIARGGDVLCVDNFFTGTKRNIAHLLSKPWFELMRHDVTFPLYVEVGHIFNLACPASPIHYQHDPVRTTKTSVHGTINKLGLARRGNPVEFTMLELAEKVIGIVGGSSRLSFKPLPQDDPRQRQPDIALATKALDWAPKISLDDGLKETVAYFRQVLAQ
ncbi:MAG: GDP-mannose 4,6-dehydratase [Rhodocyclales bacterium]|nr:GDP-mannose 4,6-dehydratase [Rhodocyclales bacterium]